MNCEKLKDSKNIRPTRTYPRAIIVIAVRACERIGDSQLGRLRLIVRVEVFEYAGSLCGVELRL